MTAKRSRATVGRWLSPLAIGSLLWAAFGAAIALSAVALFAAWRWATFTSWPTRPFWLPAVPALFFLIEHNIEYDAPDAWPRRTSADGHPARR